MVKKKFTTLNDLLQRSEGSTSLLLWSFTFQFRIWSRDYSPAGEVNTSLSGVLRFSPKVPRLIKNEIIVQLLDSFQNPVFSQQSRLKLEIVSHNNSEFSSWMFVDNNDGSYTVHYLSKDVGTYEMCASFNGISFSPCPFGVNVYSSKTNSLLYHFLKQNKSSLYMVYDLVACGLYKCQWDLCFPFPDIILNHLQLCQWLYIKLYAHSNFLCRDWLFQVNIFPLPTLTQYQFGRMSPLLLML